MKDVVETFLALLCADRATPANTVAAYRTDLMQFATFASEQGVADVAALQIDHMQAFCTWLHTQGYAAATIARRIAALRAFGTYLVQAGRLPTNPAHDLARPRLPRRTADTLSEAQIQALRAAMLQEATPEGWRDRALLDVLATTGLRASALVALDLTDLVLEQSIVRVREARGAVRSLRLTPEAVMALATYVQLGRQHFLKRDANEPALLLNCRGQRLTRQGCWEILQKYARQLRLDGVSLEQLRQVAKQPVSGPGR
jgi:integrase/recombinase XerD